MRETISEQQATEPTGRPTIPQRTREAIARYRGAVDVLGRGHFRDGTHNGNSGSAFVDGYQLGVDVALEAAREALEHHHGPEVFAPGSWARGRARRVALGDMLPGPPVEPSDLPADEQPGTFGSDDGAERAAEASS